MSQCAVVQYSDQLECGTCGAVWDVNDWDGSCARKPPGHSLLWTTVYVIGAVNFFTLGFAILRFMT